MRAALLLTCLNDVFFPNVGIATVEVLERAGCAVEFDERQTCCGQPAFNFGDRASALKVARHTLRVFAGCENLVVPSGSCASMIRWGYPQLFAGQPDLAEAKALGKRTYELSEFLVLRLGISAWFGVYPRRVAFHRSCHTRELRARDCGERLLSSLREIDLRPVEESEQCCGFGGTFAATHPHMSAAIGIEKLRHLQASGAEEVVSADTGCLMHLGGLISRTGAPLRTRHVAEVLAEAAQA